MYTKFTCLKKPRFYLFFLFRLCYDFFRELIFLNILVIYLDFINEY
ncbi:hypothetical protein ANACAC_01054 [Anaerostipes caccae L1-92]|uniref:Uncharacterized protein n=1 Tax=Anaerostipes caccae (strain DSM 14662 / CCUG 47493 / JCM 13470 / NCIMB 13811 / L1-92) TaxID=411490 RepID=B0MBN3_ANACD|nr:hypothetical protein ANACAC_01054 [Anaerostipes caccae L1-92]